MSIIYEALKKTQKTPVEPARIACALPKRHQEPTSRSPDKPLLKKRTSLVFLGITLGILSVWRIAKRPPEDREATPIADTANVIPADTAVEEAPRSPPHLILNGVVLSDDGNLAMINGQIAEAGDEMEGAKIEEITAHHVVLSFENQTIVLKNR